MVISELLLLLGCLQYPEKHNGARCGSGFHTAMKHVHSSQGGCQDLGSNWGLRQVYMTAPGALHPCVPLQASGALMVLGS